MNVRPRDLSLDRESSSAHDGERTSRKSLVSLRRNVESGVPLSKTRSAHLVMTAQPALGEYVTSAIVRNNSESVVLTLTLESVVSFGV